MVGVIESFWIEAGAMGAITAFAIYLILTMRED